MTRLQNYNAEILIQLMPRSRKLSFFHWQGRKKLNFDVVENNGVRNQFIQGRRRPRRSENSMEISNTFL